MKFKERKQKLVNEFNQNRSEAGMLQQRLNQLNTRQILIQGQLQLIDDLEKEPETKGQKTIKKEKK